MNEAMNPAVSYPARLANVKACSLTLAAAQPAVMQAFEKFHQAAAASGALDRRIKELMALAISITHGCDDCIAHHVHDAIEAGATREEFADTLGVAVLMGGGPGMIYASHAIDAIDQFLAKARHVPQPQGSTPSAPQETGMQEMMQRCCNENGEPDLEKIKQFMQHCGKKRLSDEDIAMIKEFCCQPRMPDMAKMKELMEKCGWRPS